MNPNLLSDCLQLNQTADQTITMLFDYQEASNYPPLPAMIDKALKQTFTDYQTFTDKHGQCNFTLHRFLIAGQHVEYITVLEKLKR